MIEHVDYDTIKQIYYDRTPQEIKQIYEEVNGIYLKKIPYHQITIKDLRNFEQLQNLLYQVNLLLGKKYPEGFQLEKEIKSFFEELKNPKKIKNLHFYVSPIYYLHPLQIKNITFSQIAEERIKKYRKSIQWICQNRPGKKEEFSSLDCQVAKKIHL